MNLLVSILLFFETAHELETLLQKERLAQDFNPNHEPQGAPNGTGGQFSQKENNAGSKEITNENLKFDFPEEMPPNGLKIIQENMAIAHQRCQLSKTFSILNGSLPFGEYWWFYTMVHSHAPWDYKQGHPKWENFGNFNFGAVGTACGFSEQTLLRAAGGYQEFFSKNRPKKSGHFYEKCIALLYKDSANIIDNNSNRCAYGDDPNDQNEIKKGIIYAKQHGY